MAYNFLRGDHDQPFLLPPDLRDWLPDGHLAWFVLDVVDQLDLAPFYLLAPLYLAHRADGHGHPAYDPKTLLGVLLYGYCLGVRSSRQLERRCIEDVAFRVLAANQAPDHVTIARFRVCHETALAGFLVQSLRLCAAAGMVRIGTVALDGTKLAGNAAERANRNVDKLEREVAEILRQAAEADQREDREHGDARGDELPARWPPRPAGSNGCGSPRRSWRPRPPPASSATSSGSQAPSRNRASADRSSANRLTSADLPMPASPATKTTRPPAVAASRPPSSPSAEERSSRSITYRRYRERHPPSSIERAHPHQQPIGWPAIWRHPCTHLPPLRQLPPAPAAAQWRQMANSPRRTIVRSPPTLGGVEPV
jgi:transposase